MSEKNYNDLALVKRKIISSFNGFPAHMEVAKRTQIYDSNVHDRRPMLMTLSINVLHEHKILIKNRFQSNQNLEIKSIHVKQ